MEFGEFHFSAEFDDLCWALKILRNSPLNSHDIGKTTTVYNGTNPIRDNVKKVDKKVWQKNEPLDSRTDDFRFLRLLFFAVFLKIIFLFVLLLFQILRCFFYNFQIKFFRSSYSRTEWNINSTHGSN
jgi:hypothetical protein